MMRLTLIKILLLALLLPLTLHAQQADWEITLLRAAEGENEIVTVTPIGIQRRTPIPDGFTFHPAQVALSPDGRLLAALADNNTVRIANLTQGTCCEEIAFYDGSPDFASLGGFSPDGTKIAVSYMIAEPFQAHVLTLDVASGETAAATDYVANAPDTGLLLIYPELVEWRNDGVYFVPQCIQCVEGAAGSTKGVWNPATGAISPTAEGVDPNGDLLPMANAELFPIYGADYPAMPNPDISAVGGERYGIRNAVMMSGARAENGRAVVYFDPDNLAIQQVRWVADGEAFLVFVTDGQGENVLVTPDGEAQRVDFGAHAFIAGTPDGWLTSENGELVHYTLTDGTVERATLDELSGNLIVMAEPALGSTGGAAFPTVPPPEPVTCEGFIESRLLPGHRARVRPGPANNVRERPSTIATIVAKIAGGAPFVVLEGPVCAEGLAWWRVSYQQWTGWTAEGSGSNYWLEPLD